MRAVLDDVGRIKLPDAEVTLRMSQGVHSGEFHFFAVGTSHTRAAAHRPRLEPRSWRWSTTASAGEILRQPRDRRAAAARVPGRAKGPGQLLCAAAPGAGTEAAADAAAALVHRPARALPAARRARLRARRAAAPPSTVR